MLKNKESLNTKYVELEVKKIIKLKAGNLIALLCVCVCCRVLALLFSFVVFLSPNVYMP